MAKATRRANEEALARAIKHFDDASGPHAEFCRQVEKRYKSYRGIVEQVQSASSVPIHTPKHILHIVETSLASLVEDRLRYRVKPRVTMELMYDPTAGERLRKGAFAHQVLFDWQIKRDKFNQLQRPFLLQNAIAGLSVLKTFWTERSERRRQIVYEDEQLMDDLDQPMVNPMTGEPLMMPHPREVTGYTTVYEGPTTEVRDVRDFMWHEAAVSLDKARYVIDRVHMSIEEIEEAIQDGEFGPEMGGWDRETILELLGESRDFSDEFKTREKELFNQDPNKDLIEVCEVWDQMEGDVITMANRKVLMAYRDEYPFFHERPPFTVCSTQPDLFRVQGISQVEKIEELQKLLWTLSSQRILNLELINNAIFWFRPDLEDPQAYKFEPGARWPVEDPAQVQMWTPNVIPAEVSLGAEALIKGDMQALSQSFPFASGTESQTIDQKTATGASIITSIAQRSIDLQKQQVYFAWQDAGQQRLILNQQFIRTPDVVPVLGIDDEEESFVILPELLQGDYDYELDPVPDALMKQEEQASAQALLQLAMSVVPAAAALSQSGAARMLNLDVFVEDTLKAFGKEDTERYFVSQAPPAMPGQGAAGQPAGPPSDGGGGITASQSVDPAVSPSAQISSAPSTLMQRALALSKGGARNV